MTSVRFNTAMDNRLSKLAFTTKRPKSFFIKEAVEKYLDDIEECYVALDRTMNPDSKYISSDILLNKLDNNV
jgi:RHH-type transcriptional regulator, rel operon repressor / antitoxin RelB